MRSELPSSAPFRGSLSCHTFRLLAALAFGLGAGGELYAQSTAGVTPILDGTIYNLSTREFTGSFGYTNVNASTTNIPVGLGTNFFLPGPFDRGQPTSFLAGTSHNVFTVTANSGTISQFAWTIGTTTVTASASSGTAYVPASTTYARSSGSDLFPAFDGRNSSTFNLTGGTFTATGAATLASGALLNVNGGTFNAATLANASGATLRLASGTLSATTSVQNAGTFDLRGGTLSTATLANQSGGTVTASAGSTSFLSTFQNFGTLTGSGGNLALAAFTNAGAINWQSGALTAPSIANSGTFALSGGTVTLSSGFTNTGGLRVTGGTLSTSSLGAGGFLDWQGGTIKLTSGNLATGGTSFLGTDPTLGPGQTLHLTAGATTIGSGHFVSVGPTATLVTQGGTNSGQLFVTGGTLTSESGTFTNASGATLSATSATLTFQDGLENRGVLNVIDTTVNGAVHSPVGSSINAASGVTFTGPVSGAGNFTGGGLVTFQGAYSPGDSPALVQHAGSVLFDTDSVLVMELGGLVRGTRYDALNVAGTLTFDGTLVLSLINGFNPTGGESFNLFDWGSANGSFRILDLPELDSGLSWDTSSLYTTGTVSVSVSAIPEPSTYAAIFGVLAMGVAALRRRDRA